MTRYLTQRVWGGLIALFGVSLFVFVLLRLTGDPAAIMLGPNSSRADYEQLRASMGLDQPLPVQFAIFFGGVARADFGRSFVYQSPARDVVLERFPASIELALAALVLIVVIGIPLGLLSATRINSPLDHLLSTVTLGGQAIPNFWLGIMLILLFAVQHRILPTSGRGGLTYLILPAITLSAYSVSRLARLTRVEVAETLRQDYVRTARAKGLGENRVLIRHALRNAGLSLLTVVGFDIAYLVGGSVIVETVFAWPGVGRLMLTAISQRDFPVVQATVFFLAGIVIVVNLAIDVTYRMLDPRLRLD